MISIIIPFMKDEHYEKCLADCLESLNKQAADIEIIVSEHEPERYIRKNYLLNKGFEKSTGNVIWHCDCDFTIDDPTTLQRMSNVLAEAAYPIFYSPKFKKMKPADGGLMIRRHVLDRHGPLNEKLLGISYVTFPIFNWCLKNTVCEVREDFVVNHVQHDRFKKIHAVTRAKLVSTYKSVIRRNGYKMFDMR